MAPYARCWWPSAIWFGLLLGGWRGMPTALGNGLPEAPMPPDISTLTPEAALPSEGNRSPDDSAVVRTVNLLDQPPLLPPTGIRPETPVPFAAQKFSIELFGGVNQGLLRRKRAAIATRPALDIVFGPEAKVRVTTDAGDLIFKSPFMLGVGTQRRTPIVRDPRVRGSRVGQLAASGSHWVPARIDLDTMLSKIDSRIVHDIVVIKGPYGVRYGPGFNFIDVQLLKSPRYEGGFRSHGSTSFDYQTNGQPWYGRQSLQGGNEDWGYRVGYGHRTGNDYVTGAGHGVPSSYNSRDIDVALGADLSPDSSVEFNALRLDQTDVEYPGQAFDMDFLVTDGYDLEYVLVDQGCFDRLVIDAWYNRTRFAGDAQRPGKRRQFPFLDFLRYQGSTDVDSTSTGFSAATSWGDDNSPQWTAGVDLRYLRQELNEISSGGFGLNIWQDANSPIPRSQSVDPGLFFEHVRPVGDRLDLVLGGRVDLVTTQVIDDEAKLARLGNRRRSQQSSLVDILGTTEIDQSFATWSLFISSEYELDPCWTIVGGAGHAVRPPSLTELYVAESFLFLLQNGLNTATGDPTLRPERLTQIDLGLRCDGCRFRAGVNGFYAWIHDDITFENLGVVAGPPAGQMEQINLKYVNTELATLSGFELYGECDLNCWITPFATLSYVEGRDHTRNGSFATRPASPGSPSVRDPGLPRGDFSGVTGAAKEPLPGIPPLESRLGFRFHQPARNPLWSIEFSARIVDNQNRIATSLVESPTPGFATFDIRSYWQATDRLLCVAGVENFTDRDYQEHLDFHSQSGIVVFQPGVNFYFGSELTF